MFIFYFFSKEAHSSAASLNSSQTTSLAASESQHPSLPDIRATATSKPQHEHAAASAGSSPPSDAATKNHSDTCNDSTSSSAHHGNNNVALSTPPDCPQSINGAPAALQKASRGEDEAGLVPQTSGPSAGTEGCTDSKESHRSQNCSRSSDGQSSRDRDRDRVYSDRSRDRDRHYRGRSQEHASNGDRQWYRRDHRDQHYPRSYRDRSPQSRSYRDWESDRHRERTFNNPRDCDRDRHRHCSRDDWGREWRGHGHPYHEGSHRRWKRKEEHRDSSVMKAKSKERNCYQSKETSSPARTKSKGSSPRFSTSRSASNRKDQNHFSKEIDNSPEGPPSKKHKKSKKKKSSKDKDRHCDSG